VYPVCGEIHQMFRPKMRQYIYIGNKISRCLTGTVTFFIPFFIRNKVYTNFLHTDRVYTGQSLYRTKFIRGHSLYEDKVYMGTKFIRDKVYTG
jgi:hypothetical protein